MRKTTFVSLLCVIAAFAAGSSPTLAHDDAAPARSAMIIAWHPLTQQKLAAWNDAGIGTVFNLYGDFNWQKVEPERGVFTFADWKADRPLLDGSRLTALPVLQFLEPPAWFLAEHPDALESFGKTGATDWPTRSAPNPTWRTISLAWLAAQKRGDTPAWREFSAYVDASISQMKQSSRVVGLSLPYQTFNGRICPIGHCLKELAGGGSASDVPLGDFNPVSLAAWPGPGAPPADLEQLHAGGAAVRSTWERWLQDGLGAGFDAIAREVHAKAPSYWLVIDKHIWVRESETAANPDRAIVSGLSDVAFEDFLPWVVRFADSTGDHRIVFDDDGLMDTSRIPNFQRTQSEVHAHGFLFMGESNGPESAKGLLKVVNAVHPDAVAFLPDPGGYGSWVGDNADAQAIVCVVTGERCGGAP
jgi:hypothetical protein